MTIHWQLLPLIIITILWIAVGILVLLNEDLGFIGAILVAGLTEYIFLFYLVLGVIWLISQIHIA